MRQTTHFAALAVLAAFAAACGDKAEAPAPTSAPEEPAAAAPASKAPNLDEILAAQDDAAKARYTHRHPAETLAFFGIEPGMKVVEVLPGSPGGGWYTKILAPYLGANGMLVGVDYEHSMWPLFGFMSEERIEERKSWPEQWAAEALPLAGDNPPEIRGYTFGTLPAELDGQMDAVLMIRALHNVTRFESEGGYLTTAVADAYRVLKPGGTLGVVQHRAPDSMPDDAVNGSHGYLREQFVIDTMKSAGFEMVGRSQINANPNDKPGAGDIVWRLPPTYNGVDKDDEAGRAARDAIGESDRMTLLFRKPG